MRRFFRVVQISGVLFGTLASVWAIRFFNENFFRASRYVFHFDGSFSVDQQNRIKKFVNASDSCKSLSLCCFAQKIQRRFPSINTINLFHNAHGVISVLVGSVVPMLNVNQDLVLAEDGGLFLKEIFNHESLGYLARLDFLDIAMLIDGKSDVQDDEVSNLVGRVPASLVETICKIPSELYEEYRVLCQDESKWWLQDRRQKKFLVLFNGMRMPNKAMLSACNQVKGMLDDRGVFGARCARRWVADVRFENQIILFAQAGGR